MKTFFLLFLGSVFSINLIAQNNEGNVFPIIWYNTENLFDCDDDSLTMDGAFTPEGDRHWTPKRYWTKVRNLSKAILAVSGWNDPVLVGLGEIENEKVLKDLVYNSPLAALKLKYIHQNSPDPRGIDVGLLYNPNVFHPLKTQFLAVRSTGEKYWVSRDILYCKGLMGTTDTLHVFVNHWPSKYGGAVESERKRQHAALALLASIDSIKRKNPEAQIVAMGDFNETTSEPALKEIPSSLKILEVSELNAGTHKYKGMWSQIDFFVLSENLMDEMQKGLHYQNWSVGNSSFLLEEDAAYSGVKPFRTYYGYQYQQGFSDHLPIVLYLGKNK